MFILRNTLSGLLDCLARTSTRKNFDGGVDHRLEILMTQCKHFRQIQYFNGNVRLLKYNMCASCYEVVKGEQSSPIH